MALQKRVIKRRGRLPDLSVSTRERKAEKRKLIARKKKEDRQRRKVERFLKRGGDSIERESDKELSA